MAHTPSSLKWLITKYARVQGELQSLEKKHEALKERTAVLRREAKALREVLGLHEIQVDPNDIQPKTPHLYKRILAHGQATRLALGFLRQAKGALKSTDEITEHVIVSAGVKRTPEVFLSVRQTVKYSLRQQVLNGLVERQHVPAGNGGFGMGYWRIIQE